MCISKLSLGTAQFGSPYGITRGATTIDEAELASVIVAARTLGINKIDTSQSYGTAEKRLGQLDLFGFEITTKLYVPKTRAQLKKYDPVEHLEASLRDLRVDSVKSVLIHNAHELEYELQEHENFPETNDAYMDLFNEMTIKIVKYMRSELFQPMTNEDLK